MTADSSQSRSLFGRAARGLALALAVVLCLALAAVVLAAMGSPDQPRSFSDSLRIIGREMWERLILPQRPGAATAYRNWIITLQATTPLMLAGLAVAVALRAGVLNIGAQGQYIAGAIASTAVAIYAPIGSPPLLIAAHLLAAALGGAALAAVAGLLERWRNVPVVLSTLLLNFVALEFLLYLLRGPMRPVNSLGMTSDPQSQPLPQAARLPEFLLGETGRGFGSGIFLALVCAVLIALTLRWTTFGFRIRAVGANPEAARFAGMNVGRISVLTLAISGSLAGLAGAVQVAGSPSPILYPDLGTDAVGFTAIAVALLGGLTPAGVVFSALFFGLLSSAFTALANSELAIHASTAQAVQGALILCLLVVSRIRVLRRGP